jgi:uncharacterized protein
MSMVPNRPDLPTIDTFTEAFWRAAKCEQLLIRRCEDCGRVHYYPRPFCPSCWSNNVAWVKASGRAVLYTYSTIYENDLPPFVDLVPYVAAVVDLEEGPRMTTQIIDCDPRELRIGLELEVAFRPVTDEITLPVFRPVAGEP